MYIKKRSMLYLRFWHIIGKAASWWFSLRNWLMVGYLGRGVHIYPLGTGYVVEILSIDNPNYVSIGGEVFAPNELPGLPEDDDLAPLKAALIEVALHVGGPKDYKRIRDLLFREEED